MLYNLIEVVNYNTEKITNKPSVDINSYSIYKLICNCNKFYIGKTNRSFKIKYNKYILDIKNKKKIFKLFC